MTSHNLQLTHDTQSSGAAGAPTTPGFRMAWGSGRIRNLAYILCAVWIGFGGVLYSRLGLLDTIVGTRVHWDLGTATYFVIMTCVLSHAPPHRSIASPRGDHSRTQPSSTRENNGAESGPYATDAAVSGCSL